MSYDTNDLRSMNLIDLRKLATGMGISGLSKRNKDSVLSAIKYRIDHPCKDNKILVNSRCQIPSDIKALKKADLEVIASAHGIRNVKSYNKEELTAKLKKMFDCGTDEYVNAFTEECTSKNSNMSEREEDSGSERDEESGSERDEDSESERAEDSESEREDTSRCDEARGVIQDMINNKLPVELRDYENIIKRFDSAEKEEYFTFADTFDSNIKDDIKNECKWSDDEIDELTDRYTNGMKQLPGFKRYSCNLVIENVLNKIENNLEDDLEQYKKQLTIDEISTIADEWVIQMQKEIEELGCYDLMGTKSLDSLIDKYTSIITRGIIDRVDKNKSTSGSIASAEQMYVDAKSKLRKTTTNDKSGANVDGVDGDWSMKSGKDIQIPCGSFRGKSSCEFEYGGMSEGVDLRRCRWNQTGQTNFCEPLPDDLNERLRITLGLSREEFERREKPNCDWVEMFDPVTGAMYKYNLCNPDQREWLPCDDVDAIDETTGARYRYNNCTANDRKWVPNDEVDNLIAEMVVEGGREEAKAIANKIREDVDSEIKELSMKSDETDKYVIMAETTFDNYKTNKIIIYKNIGLSTF